MPPGSPSADPISDRIMSLFTTIYRPGILVIMSTLLRLERQQKRFLKFHFEFAYFSFFLPHLKLKRQVRLSFQFQFIPSTTIPVFRPKRSNNRSLGSWQKPHAPFGVALTYRAYMREYPKVNRTVFVDSDSHCQQQF